MQDLEQCITDIQSAISPETDELLTISLQPKTAIGGIWLDDADEFWKNRVERFKDILRNTYGDTHYSKTVTEDITMHRFNTGNTTISYAHALRGLIVPEIRRGTYISSVTIQEPIINTVAAGKLFKELLKENLFIYNETEHTAYRTHNGKILSLDNNTLHDIGINVNEICEFVNIDGVNSYQYINLQRPHSGAPLFLLREYEC